MATTSHSPAPVSRFPRLGLGLRLKPSNMTPSRSRKDEKRAEDEWYIPYSGPYEPPQEPVRRRNDRDSWGDPTYGGDNEDATVLASIELRKLYDNGSDNIPGGESRDRMQSGVSGRTISSGNVDPRISNITQRRSTVTSAYRPNVTSYISIDTSGGGIGESPVPLSHQRNSSKENNKGTTLSGLFAFGGQARNKSLSERNSGKLLSKKPRTGLGVGPITSTHRRSSSTGSNSLLDRGYSHPDNPTTGVEATNEDLYNSYYFSSRASQNSTPNHPYRATSPVPPVNAPKLNSSPPQSTRHPYAYVFPTSRYDDHPQTAPLPSSEARVIPNIPDAARADPYKLTFTEPPAPPPKPATANVPQFSIPSTFPFQKGLKRLKNSASTPDLRIGTSSASPQSRTKGLSSSKPSSTFKPKDRWLSAETWCDALLFPRPRLKVRQEDGGEGYGSRIVSPPGSPVYEMPGRHTGNGGPVQGVASRVLAHSRSMADLNRTRESPIPDRQLPAVPPPPPPKPPQPNGAALTVNTDRPPRPKSWALDDLDLPTPVPSLARVLEEGEKLEAQRKQWKEQATNSFRNQRTRSVSRVRSKSLTQKARKREDPRPTNIDLLAARAYLGNQLMTPVVATMRKPTETQTVSFSSGGKSSSHGHTNSLAKTMSKSSKSHSRSHSRSDSWGRSALKIAKTAACGLSVSGNLSPAVSVENGLESALRRDDTKIIRLADPAVDEPAAIASSSPTPPASVISEMRIGIALTTPPLVDNSAEPESTRLLAHPYAQAGMYTYTKARQGKELSADHREPVVQQSQPTNKSRPADIPTISLPQRAGDRQPAIYHPYAQPSPLEPYVHDNTLTPYSRVDSDIPPAAKMWARFSPGVVREILPGEIMYSPFMSEDGDASEAADDSPPAIYDTVGVGEALAYAVQRKSSKDSGLGTSEDHAAAADVLQPQPAAVAAKRSYRQPVQYDTTRPPHLLLSKQEKKPSDPNSARTFASSPLLHQQSTPPELPRHNSSRSGNLSPSRTTSTSPESLSPSQSPRSFGHPDDLESFHDLFYKRSANSTRHRIQSEVASTAPQGSRLRTGSGLTSLARQLSEELEAMAGENEGSQYSRSSATGLTTSTGPRPTESTLEFVFEETSPPESFSTSQSPLAIAAISPFQASSARIPEDISSSRASSPLEGSVSDEDRTEELRLGLVESVATPPPIDNDHRSSLSGLTFGNERNHLTEDQHSASPSTQPRTLSGLQPPSADPTRSSYMTTSTVSRISGLSDFPVPPQRHLPGHISLLTSYFDEAHTLSEANASRNHTPPAIPAPSNDTDKRYRRLTFGGEEEIEEIEEIEELVAALSSHSHSPHP